MAKPSELFLDGELSFQSSLMRVGSPPSLRNHFALFVYSSRALSLTKIPAVLPSELLHEPTTMAYSGPMTNISATDDKPSAGDPIPPRCYVIEVHVGELKQLFNSIDPSPFRNKDLDPKAEE